MSEYLNLLDTILGALISLVTSYVIIKIKNNFDERTRLNELIFNEKKKVYYEFLSKLNLKFDFDIDFIQDNLIHLSYIELISDNELYEKCQELPQIFLNINKSKDETEINKNIAEYGKVLREIKDAMRKELHTINKCS